MKIKLRTKLIASFAATALICVILIGLFSNMQLNRLFQQYVIQNQEKSNNEVVRLINAQLERHKGWDGASIEDIGVNALERGLLLTIRDSDDSVIWDAYVYNNGMCQQMTSSMYQNMMNNYPQWQGKLMKQSFPLEVDGNELGTVDIGFYGPFYFDESDLIFIRALNSIFFSVGFFSLALALIFGAILSKKISTPIIRVTKTAEAIAQGNYRDRSTEVSSTAEISQLTRAINELAESLESQDALRKRLTGDVAHELRTPLATLQSHMEAMIDGIWDPTSERLTSCHEEITRITRLVSDLEKLAQFENENNPLERVFFSASDWIYRLAQNYETEFAYKNVALIINCDDGTIFADKDKLSQVVINLLSNALKFTGEGGSVTVAVRQESICTSITVCDTGIGIADKDLPHIFQRFYRADESRNRMTGGSGIGLTLVKAMVEAHGGSVAVESEIGKGTCVTLRIPL